jgi:hypothetical protein
MWRVISSVDFAVWVASRVERQQIGAGGDLADDVGDGTDAPHLLVQRLDRGACLATGLDRAGNHRR